MKDYLFINGIVLTMEGESIAHEACAVTGDTIVGAGTVAEIKARAGNSCEEIDLSGGVLIPGFTDCHLHLVLSAYFKMNTDLADVGSVAELLSIIKDKAAALAPGAWIMGLRFREDNFPDKRMPTLPELDASAPANPVLLIRYDGHTGLVNSAALAAASITENTPDPPGGLIGREHGRLTGMLKELAVDLALAALPPPDVEEFRKGFHLFMDDLSKSGIVRVHSVLQTGQNGPAGSLGPFEIPLLKLFENEVHQSIYPLVAATSVAEAVATLTDQFGAEKIDGRWRGGALKIFVDGTFGSRTARFSEDYSDMPGERGMMVIDIDALRKTIFEAEKEGLQVAAHIIGDEAITETVRIFLEARRSVNGPNLRHRIEHSGMIRRSDFSTIREAGIILSFQPSFIVSEGGWIESRVGKKRLGDVYAIRRALEQQIPICGGSDSPIESPSVLAGLWGAVTRRGFTADQRLTPFEALSLYTSRAAYASFDEGTRGTIQAGKRADLVVLDRDPRRVSPDEIRDINVKLTMIAGEIRYGG
ncbi:MAG: amidohydrolase [Deltaproteobacteria bacterium]|nr:amidohydrolase [Candidatus Zymogenaceae bacterium]